MSHIDLWGGEPRTESGARCELGQGWLSAGDLDVGPSIASRLRATLERLAATQRSSAARLRWHGQEGAACRAERAAARIHLSLDEPAATKRMFAISRHLAVTHADVLLDDALDGAIELVGADFGNIQTCDATSGALTIATSRGFDEEFLAHFAVVDNPSSACGRAVRQRSQAVIVDVRRDASFAPHRAIAAGAGFRGVQSTPIVARNGRLYGVLSTHFSRPCRLSPRDLQLMDWYADRVALVLEHSIEARVRAPVRG